MPNSEAQSCRRELIFAAIAEHDLGADPDWRHRVVQLPDGSDPGKPPALKANDGLDLHDAPETGSVIQGDRFRTLASPCFEWICACHNDSIPDVVEVMVYGHFQGELAIVDRLQPYSEWGPEGAVASA